MYFLFGKTIYEKGNGEEMMIKKKKSFFKKKQKLKKRDWSHDQHDFFFLPRVMEGCYYT
jgi:hypothetical protein